MAKAGRPKGSTGVRMGEDHRTKIRNSKILSMLVRHAEGETTEDGKELLSQSQANAGLGLLKKCLPDLSSVQHSGDPDRPLVHKIEREIVRPENKDG